MFACIVLLLLMYRANGEPDSVKYRCSISSNKSMTFKPSVDEVPGRYTAELCASKNPKVVSWKIDLSSYDNPKYCRGYKRLKRPDHEHSTNTLDIHDPTNCTHVCYSMNFDLIFSGCYGIKSTFQIGGTSEAPYDTFHFINNNITKEYFAMNKPHVSFVNHDNEVSLYWFLGIPPTEFEVELCSRQNNTPECIWTEDVSGNCSLQHVTQLHCFLRPPHGCYRARLLHEAPWIAGIFNNQSSIHYDFCHHAAELPVGGAGGAGGARVWWALGAALAAAALLAAAGLRAALRSRDYHKGLWKAWLRNTTREVEVQPVVEPVKGPVLLLYAREGEHGQKAIEALKTLIQESTGLEVLDLFSAEVTALCASAPGSWLRAALRAPHTRVLLLQSPAAAALYDTPLNAGLQLSEPLLSRRAVYRSPLFGDGQLALALRTIAEDVSSHHAYHKYYLATYSELETELLRDVVPYRRYGLPATARALLRDLAGGTSSSPASPASTDTAAADAALLAFERAAHALLQHVQHNPDYLMDELVIV